MNRKQVNIKKICKLYHEGMSLINIAKECGFKSYPPIAKILKENNIPIKKRGSGNSRLHNLDETFFNVIDTPDKAYILGWVISDGYVNKYKLKFGLKDLDILNEIKKIMKSEHKISEVLTFDKRTKKTYKQYSLQITSKKIIDSLNKLGIYQAKSFTVDLPIIPKELYSHLIRGIFDGDGYVGIRTNNNGDTFPRFSMIVSEKLYNKLEPIFIEINVNFMKPELISEKNGDRILKILIYQKKELRLLFDYMYGTSDVTKLTRKYEKFKESLDGEDPVGNTKINKLTSDGKLIKGYKSARNAAKDNNISYRAFYYHIVEKSEKEYCGFRWEISN